MKLTVNSGSKQGSDLDLTGRTACVIGREPDCDVVLDDDTKVSRRHASFEPTPDGGVLLRDLGSANGTFVNGNRVTDPVRLLGGETVLIGTTSIVVTTPVAAPAGLGATEPAGPFPPAVAAGALAAEGLAPGAPPTAAATNLAPAGPDDYTGAPAAAAPPPAALTNLAPAGPNYYIGAPGPAAAPPYGGAGAAGANYGPPGWAAPPPNDNRGRIIGLSVAAAVLAIALIIGLVLLLTGGDDDNGGGDSFQPTTGQGQRPGAGTDPGGSAGGSNPGGDPGTEATGLERYCAVLANIEQDLATIPEPATEAEAQQLFAQFLNDHRRDFLQLVALAEGSQRGDLGTIFSAFERAADGDSAALAGPQVEAAFTRLSEDESCA